MLSETGSKELELGVFQDRKLPDQHLFQKNVCKKTSSRSRYYTDYSRKEESRFLQNGQRGEKRALSFSVKGSTMKYKTREGERKITAVRKNRREDLETHRMRT